MNTSSLKAGVWRAILSMVPLAAATMVRAQSVASSDIKKEDEPIILSPFTVTDTSEVGYVATDTLAGTRIRTDLRDVASSVSIYTKEFMKDIGATDAKGLLIYTNGTEVAGMAGTMTGETTAAGAFGIDLAPERFSPNPTNRVRGLAGADNTRDSYQTIIPLDSYNISRVTINRGANSILFGLGSPAGIIDRSLESALSRNQNKVEVRVDGHGSLRGVLDINRVLIPRKLEARVILLHEEKKFRQKPSFDTNRRIFGAFGFRPFPSTQIRVNAEFGDRLANPEVLGPPRDRLTVWWTHFDKATIPLGWGYNAVSVAPRTSFSDVPAGYPFGVILDFDNGISAPNSNGYPGLIFQGRGMVGAHGCPVKGLI